MSLQEPRFKPSRETDYEECTFQPKISKRSIEIAGTRTLASPEEMYKKNQEWVEQKEKFLDEMRDGKQASEERNLQECTFNPNRQVRAAHPGSQGEPAAASRGRKLRPHQHGVHSKVSEKVQQGQDRSEHLELCQKG